MDSYHSVYCARRQDAILYAISVTYVDYIIRSGDQYFKNLSKGTHYLFYMVHYDHFPCLFAYLCLSRDTLQRIILDKHAYLTSIKPLPKYSTFNHFSFSRMQLPCLSHSIPYLFCNVSALSQVFEAYFNSHQPKMVKVVNNLLLYYRETPVQLFFERLELDSLHFFGFE